MKIGNKKRGVTLIEMMVVLGIISMMTALVLVGFSSMTGNFSLEKSVTRMVQDIRDLVDKSMNFSEYTITGCSNTGPVSYALEIEEVSKSYKKMVYILNSSGEITEDCKEEIETISLDLGKISSIVFNDCIDTYTDAGKIVFTSNPQQVFIGDINTDVVPWTSSCNSVTIKISLDDLSEEKTIEINKSGAIGIVSQELCYSGDENKSKTIRGDVIYCDSSLNAWTTTIDSEEWCNNVSISEVLGDYGKQNTETIIDGCIERPIAASICNSLIWAGKSGWHLPSGKELREDFGNSACSCDGVDWNGTGGSQLPCDLKSDCGEWDSDADNYEWTSSMILDGSSYYPQYISFSNGSLVIDNSNVNYYFRCMLNNE
jgi:prepilin-type N-terminal cleavage/methylation domain-containing protein